MWASLGYPNRSLIFYQAEGNAGYWWISDPDFDEAVRLRSGAPNGQWFDSDVINDGDGVDQGIADTVVKMGEADSEQRNGLVGNWCDISTTTRSLVQKSPARSMMAARWIRVLWRQQ
ncbi:hypothetical protein DFH09DRAFT_1075786 [Mycena vulgaris]|nr:hypothetical protein DFH09DRAFT_1075786 [Mycena vulgaris]